MTEHQSIPRAEYPRPQFVRDERLCLNGRWQFEQDLGDSGLERGVAGRELSGTITVPFCPESALSGIGYTDFMQAVWYRRIVRVPAGWAGRRVVLHFGAVDYDATVWVNGTEVARHRGRFTPFQCDLSGVVDGGDDATIVVRARDDWRPPQPRGKQSQKPLSHGCLYTRTTGIWQTVWMEPVSHVHLRRPRVTPDVANGAIRLELPLSNNRAGYRVRAALSTGGAAVAKAEASAAVDLAPGLDLFSYPGRVARLI